MSQFITSDDPSAKTVLLKAAQKLEELMADRNLAQLEVDNWKAEVSKLTHQQTGREAERALKRQIDGFLSGQDNSLEQRVTFNNWLRDQDLVLCIEDAHDLVAASGEPFHLMRCKPYPHGTASLRAGQVGDGQLPAGDDEVRARLQRHVRRFYAGGA